MKDRRKGAKNKRIYKTASRVRRSNSDESRATHSLLHSPVLLFIFFLRRSHLLFRSSVFDDSVLTHENAKHNLCSLWTTGQLVSSSIHFRASPGKCEEASQHRDHSTSQSDRPQPKCVCSRALRVVKTTMSLFLRFTKRAGGEVIKKSTENRREKTVPPITSSSSLRRGYIRRME